MESFSFGTIISVIIGGAITFLASYILENRRRENDKFKFRTEKIISVGEEYYRFSAYALLRFETLLDTYNYMLDYSSQEAVNTLFKVDENLKTLLTKIGENNITITSADIYFGVSGADAAAKFINEIKNSEAKFHETSTPLEMQVALDDIKLLIKNYITVIKHDREIIRLKILEILQINVQKRNTT